MKKDKKKRNHKEIEDAQNHETIRQFVNELKLGDLPWASKFNLALSLILLIGIIPVAAEPVLVGATNIFILLLNFIISLRSTQVLLPMREIDAGKEAFICFIVLFIEVFFCMLVVFFMDGFKHRRDKEK